MGNFLQSIIDRDPAAKSKLSLTTAQQLVHEHTQSPPVHGAVVPLILDHLGREVLRRTTGGVRLTRRQHLGQAHVRDLAEAASI